MPRNISFHTLEANTMREEAELFLRIYNESFPEEERRPYADVGALADFMALPDSKEFHIIAVLEEGKMAGFITYWDFRATAGYVYVEHLAVDPHLRGAGLGAALLHHLEKTVDAPLLLEVEPESAGEMACRRIGFYKRLGFHAHPDFDYMQPPYAPGLPWVPLMIMTSRLMQVNDEMLIPIKCKVYRV